MLWRQGRLGQPSLRMVCALVVSRLRLRCVQSLVTTVRVLVVRGALRQTLTTACVWSRVVMQVVWWKQQVVMPSLVRVRLPCRRITCRCVLVVQWSLGQCRSSLLKLRKDRWVKFRLWCAVLGPT